MTSVSQPTIRCFFVFVFNFFIQRQLSPWSQHVNSVPDELYRPTSVSGCRRRRRRRAGGWKGVYRGGRGRASAVWVGDGGGREGVKRGEGRGRKSAKG